MITQYTCEQTIGLISTFRASSLTYNLPGCTVTSLHFSGLENVALLRSFRGDVKFSFITGKLLSPSSNFVVGVIQSRGSGYSEKHCLNDIKDYKPPCLIFPPLSGVAFELCILYRPT